MMRGSKARAALSARMTNASFAARLASESAAGMGCRGWACGCPLPLPLALKGVTSSLVGPLAISEAVRAALSKRSEDKSSV